MSEANKKFFHGFSFKYLYRIIFFQIVFDILITKFRFTDTKLFTTPQQEQDQTSKLALHSCDDSQLQVKMLRV